MITIPFDEAYNHILGGEREYTPNSACFIYSERWLVNHTPGVGILLRKPHHNARCIVCGGLISKTDLAVGCCFGRVNRFSETYYLHVECVPELKRIKQIKNIQKSLTNRETIKQKVKSVVEYGDGRYPVGACSYCGKTTRRLAFGEMSLHKTCITKLYKLIKEQIPRLVAEEI